MTTTCHEAGCERPARMAVKTARPSAAKLTTTVYYDDRDAPKAALRYCKTHGVAVLADLAGLLADGDDDPPAPRRLTVTDQMVDAAFTKHWGKMHMSERDPERWRGVVQAAVDAAPKGWGS